MRESMSMWRRGRIKCQWFDLDGPSKRSRNDSANKVREQRQRRISRKLSSKN